MSVKDILDTMRRDCPGCVLVAFGDREAGLVLRSSAATPWRQEHLHALCTCGDRVLSQAAWLSSDGAGDRRVCAIVTEGRDIRLFAGFDTGNSDLLCCVLAAGTETDVPLDRIRTALGQLTEQAA